jgi:hypothetical protein
MDGVRFCLMCGWRNYPVMADVARELARILAKRAS